MKRVNLFTIRAFASVLIFLLSACAEDPLGGNDQTDKGHTITLRLSATVAPIPETKTIAMPAHPDSEAEKAGFYYEMVSSDMDRAATPPGFNFKPMSPKEENSEINFATKALATKAPSTLKNAYALLFTSAGAFNGRALIGVFTVGSPQDITVTNVVNPTATSCRLVIVANNNAAVTPYASSGGTGGFANFSGTYAEFQKLIITNAVNQDIDVPYAGSATVDLSQSEIGVTADVTLSWTLAKITLNNSTFNIVGGPARSSIKLYNAGMRRFATQGNDNYNGTGNTQTTAFVATTDGSNTNSVTWYVGENIRPAGTGIKTKADRNSSNAPKNACYIRIASAAQSAVNKSPQIGEEYIESGTQSFTYDYYLGNSSVLTDFALRRHTDYLISTEISGTIAIQEEIAARDGRVTLTRPEPAGLVIGRFGGPSYSSGNGDANTTKGAYTSMLLLEPNTSRRTAISDNVMKVWGAEGTKYQEEARKSWDRTYIYGITTGGTIGGMNTASGSLHAYCNELTLGGVPVGTWYVPTVVQLQMIWAAYEGLKEGGFDDYNAFVLNSYWSCTENLDISSWGFEFDTGNTFLNVSKTSLFRVRCVRDLV